MTNTETHYTVTDRNDEVVCSARLAQTAIDNALAHIKAWQAVFPPVLVDVLPLKLLKVETTVIEESIC